MDTSKGVALSLAGVAIFEIAKLYQNSVPPLSDITKAHPEDDGMWASLVHADLFVGGIAALAALWLAFTFGSVLPVLLIGAVFVFTAVLHHKVLDVH